MSSIGKTVLALLALVLILTTARADEPASDLRPNISHEPQPLSLIGPTLYSRKVAARLRTAMQKPISLDLEEQSLNGLIDYLQETTGAPMRMDRQSMEIAGILPDEPVSGKYVELPAGIALSRILEDLDLIWVIRTEVVLITSEDADRKQPVRQSIDVTDLLAWIKDNSPEQRRDEFGRPTILPRWGRGPGRSSEAELTELISMMSSGWWAYPSGGFGGTISYNNGIATITQSVRDLESARRLIGLMQFVSARPPQPVAWYLEEDGFAAPATRRTRSQMLQTVKLDAVDAPLDNVLDKLSRDSGLLIQTDWIALEESGVLRDEPVTINIEASLQAVLNNVLSEFGLVALPRDNGLFVTIVDIEHEIRVTALFDVRDLTAKGIPGWTLVDTIMQEAEGQWEDTDPGGIILEVGGLLFVRQSLSSLSDVELLLRDLRDASPLEQRASMPDAHTTDVTRFYDVADTVDADRLVTALKSFVYPDRWNANIGSGEVIAVGQSLIIRQTPEVHAAIAAFLAKLNRSKPEE